MASAASAHPHTDRRACAPCSATWSTTSVRCSASRWRSPGTRCGAPCSLRRGAVLLAAAVVLVTVALMALLRRPGGGLATVVPVWLSAAAIWAVVFAAVARCRWPAPRCHGLRLEESPSPTVETLRRRGNGWNRGRDERDRTQEPPQETALRRLIEQERAGARRLARTGWARTSRRRSTGGEQVSRHRKPLLAAAGGRGPGGALAPAPAPLAHGPRPPRRSRAAPAR